jgi:hypothetical protein
MRSFHITVKVIILFLMVLVSACAPRSEPVISEGPPLPVTGAGATEPAMTDEPAEPAVTDTSAEPQFADFDPNNFDANSTVIDNEWNPLKPGTFWAYEGSALDDNGEKIDRRIEFTVSDLTKEIAGVHTAVAWIVDYTNGEIVEKELSFYAQDKVGNVWYLGEHPEEYEDGEFVNAPTWIAGIEDAKPGIKMQADPQLGTGSIFQGWGPAVEWSDYGQVDAVGQKTCVPVDCYEDVLVVAESSLGEEGAYQLKSYARGVGNVQVGWRGTDETQEELGLVEYKQLDPDGLADIHTKVLDLEKHAYEISKDMYGQTLPSESQSP